MEAGAAAGGSSVAVTVAATGPDGPVPVEAQGRRVRIVVGLFEHGSAGVARERAAGRRERESAAQA